MGPKKVAGNKDYAILPGIANESTAHEINVVGYISAKSTRPER